ncbi:MAG: hypothetical protein LAN71_17990 [Acidobacteriia bacterium]|nr:hypothetical protein [Terriglobia bacterium]
MDIFVGNNFIVQSGLIDSKDVLGIVDASMKPICYVKHEHSWKGPDGKAGAMIGKRMRTTDVRFEGIDGAALGEIHENPDRYHGNKKMERLRCARQFKGVVVEKPKFVGSDWVLENVEGTTVATVKGDQKNHDFQVVTADKYQQVLARCSVVNQDSCRVELMLSDFDPFFVLSYVVVLDLAKASMVIRGRGF